MDYSRYVVDPWRGAKEAQGVNAMNEQNAFARQRYESQERQNALNNQYRDRQEARADRTLDRSESQQDMQLLAVQADVVGKALDNVTDEQSYQGFKQFLQQLGPMADSKLLKFITTQSPPNYDPRVIEQGKQFLSSLRQAPAQEKPTSSMREFEFAKQNPEFSKFLQNKKPVTEITMAQEKEYDKAMGKTYAEDYTTYLRAASEAQSNNIRLERAKSLVTRLETGALKPTTNAIKRVIADLGQDVSKLGLKDDVGLAEALNAVSVDLTMDTVQRTKGAVSNKEMELFAQVAPQISNTVEGNLLIIEMSQRLNENKIKVAQLARKYTQKNKRFDDGFYAELDTFHAENPLFTEGIYAKVKNLTGAAKEAQSRGITAPPPTDFSNLSDDELKNQLGVQ